MSGRDLFAEVADSGFTYLSFDLSKGASVTAWNRKANKTFYGRGATLPDALAALLDKPKAASRGDDILGDLL